MWMWAHTEFPSAFTPKRQITGFGISSLSSMVQNKNIIIFPEFPGLSLFKLTFVRILLAIGAPAAGFGIICVVVTVELYEFNQIRLWVKWDVLRSINIIIFEQVFLFHDRFLFDGQSLFLTLVFLTQRCSLDMNGYSITHFARLLLIRYARLFDFFV